MRRFAILLLGPLVLLLTFAVYFPGLSGSFLFDDAPNIIANPSIRMAEFDIDKLRSATFSGAAGMFGRPISMASFALDHWRGGGMDPHAFKVTNVLIHLATGLAVFAFIRLLLQAHQVRLPVKQGGATLGWISLAIATAWLVHPINLTSVLYIVQRMTSLAALFSLLALVSYLWGRLRVARAPDRRGWLAVGASFLVFTPLAALSKENGALVPLFLLLTEFAFFRFETHSARASRTLKGVFLVTVALPAVAILGYTVFNPQWILEPYKMRSFSLGERLLTETRVLWLYMRMVFVPDLTLLGLYHDDLVTSKSLLDPITTLPATIGLVALALLVPLAWRRQRLLAYGIAFFLLGHSMESSFLALELMHEHRNYFPVVGLLLPLFYYLISAKAHFDHRAVHVGVVVALIAMFASVTVLRSMQWGDKFEMLVKEVEHHPGSARAQIAIANFYFATPPESQADAEMIYKNTYEHFALAAQTSPTETIGLFGLIALHARQGLPIEPTWLPALTGRIRNNPMSASTVQGVSNFTVCHIEKTCSVPADVVEAILHAALANRTARPNQRAQLLFALSGFLLYVKKDIDAAVKAGYEALALAPGDMGAQIAFINYLIDADRDKEALVRLAELRRLDRLQLHTSTANRLQAFVEKRLGVAPAAVKQP